MLAARRGFTLVELLAVVAMVGILAAIAMVGYRRYLMASHSSEAIAVLQGIRGGQEAAKAESLVYLDCSGGSLSSYYPHATADKTKWHWSNPAHAAFACWRQLNVVTDGPVRYVFSTVAGAAGATSFPTVPELVTQPTWPNPAPDPWYIVQAIGDQDGDGAKSMFLASSFSGEVYQQNESE
jgi:type IV pilus assembly protein PilA